MLCILSFLKFISVRKIYRGYIFVTISYTTKISIAKLKISPPRYQRILICNSTEVNEKTSMMPCHCWLFQLRRWILSDYQQPTANCQLLEVSSHRDATFIRCWRSFRISQYQTTVQIIAFPQLVRNKILYKFCSKYQQFIQNLLFDFI